MNQHYKDAVAACVKCSGSRDVVNVPRRGTGPDQPRLMIVGQNPPIDPFRCKPGAWLLHFPNVEKGPHELLVHELLAELGYRTGEVWATQAMKCPTLSNDRPSILCVKDCAQRFLRWEIEEKKPAIVLAFGELAHVGVMTSVQSNPTLGSHYKVRYCEPVGASVECEVRHWTTYEGMKIIQAPHPSKVTRFINKTSWINLIKWAVES